MLRKKRVSFENRQLRKRVKSWLKNAGCSMKEFKCFLEDVIELKLPVNIFQISDTSMMFCTDSTGRSVKMHIYDDVDESISHIRVMMDKSITKCYAFTPVLTYTGSIVEISGRKIEAVYMNNELKYSIACANNIGPVTDVIVYGPKDKSKDKIQTQLEEYVNNYRGELKADKIYKEMCQVLGVAKVMEIQSILISCTGIMSPNEIRITRLKSENNKPVECTAIKGASVYRLTWSLSGFSWEYECSESKLTYSSEKDEHNIKGRGVLKIETIKDLYKTAHNGVDEICKMLEKALTF